MAANTNLITAVKNGKLSVVRKLINKYQAIEDIASVQFTDDRGYSSIHHSVTNPNVDIAKLLLEHD